MTTAAKQLLDKVMELDEADRVEFVERLWDAVEPITGAEYDSAWGAEIERRLADIDSGKAKMIPAEEAIRRIRERAGCDD
jgi:putative addiction module component (TIGR02574 family)